MSLFPGVRECVASGATVAGLLTGVTHAQRERLAAP